MNTESSVELLTVRETAEDTTLTFTPTTFDQYLGQSQLKEKLHVYTTASRQRNEALDHLLLFGPPGLGKTTLARVVANELDVPIRITSAPAIERSGDLVALLTNLQPREVFFIDEIHRLAKNIEEILYSAMEQFCVDMIIGQGAGAKAIRLPIQPFTLIGATTKTALLSGALQTRFGIVERIDFYEREDLAAIVEANAKFVDVPLSSEGALAIGNRARGTPRIAKRLFRRVRDYAQVHELTPIDVEVTNKALEFLGIDDDGLNALDRKLLTHILKDFDGGPVGLDTLAAITGEDKDTLEDFCEPYLMRQGLLQKTPRGRQVPSRQMLKLRRRFLGDVGAVQEDIFGE